MNEYDVIIRPYITEKTTDMVSESKYAFVVNIKATKIDIKKAVEKLFGVKVVSVNTVRYDGKKKTRRQADGSQIGYTSRWKKAIVKIDNEPATVTYMSKGGKLVKADKKYKTSIEDFGFVQ